MLGDLAQLKTYPDADLEFLVNLETSILSKLRQPVAQSGNNFGPGGAPAPNADMGAAMMAGGGGMVGGPPPSMPPPGAGPGGATPTYPAPPQGGVPGVMNGPAPIPNPDELRRLLQRK